MATPDVKVILTAIDNASKQIKNVTKELGGMEDAGVQASQNVADQSNLLTTAIQGIGVAAALATAKMAVMKTYEMGRAGAEIEFTTQKFDNLAKSIGTTAYALEKDLDKAFMGTASSAKQMETVADLVGLGIAKTHDEAIRLANVSAKLGMDMSHLVLTLTNQSTMRFDTLGVSIDGFKEKVAELEASGLSAEDAFNEAFLRQAERQIELVGDATQESIGDFQRFEAAIANATDAVKVSIGDMTHEAVGDLATMLVAWTEYFEGERGTQSQRDARHMAEIEALKQRTGFIKRLSAEGQLAFAIEMENLLKLQEQENRNAKVADGTQDQYMAYVDERTNAIEEEIAREEDLALARYTWTSDQLDQLAMSEQAVESYSDRWQGLADTFEETVPAAEELNDEFDKFAGHQGAANGIADGIEAMNAAIQDTVDAFNGLDVNVTSKLSSDLNKLAYDQAGGGDLQKIVEAVYGDFGKTGDKSVLEERLRAILAVSAELDKEVGNAGYWDTYNTLLEGGLSRTEASSVLQDDLSAMESMAALDFGLEIEGLDDTTETITLLEEKTMWLEDTTHHVYYEGHVSGQWPSGSTTTAPGYPGAGTNTTTGGAGDSKMDAQEGRTASPSTRGGTVVNNYITINDRMAAAAFLAQMDASARNRLGSSM